jgi:branched-chain amino acid transport system ATP-binding protein
MTTCLSTVSVSKQFGSLRAVDAVSFEVNSGEVFGIAGPNGAGKTTLFNLITGVPFGPDSGEVWFEGKRIDGLASFKIFRRGLARTFQQETAFDSLTVEDNLNLAMHYSGHRWSASEKRASLSRSLESTELTNMRKRLAGGLAFFEKKRLMLATALAAGPRLLMLDEPAAGLSQDEGQALITMVEQVNRSGVTVVVIEHVLPILFGVSHRLLILDAGQILTVDKPEKVASDPRVVSAYLGERRADPRGRDAAGR